MFSHFWLTIKQAHTRGTQLYIFIRGYKRHFPLTLISLSADMFLYRFYPWPYILNVQASSCKTADIFSIAVHVFHNLFWKIFILLGQILITCLKSSRTSFLLSSYSKKMRWGRGSKYLSILLKLHIRYIHHKIAALSNMDSSTDVKKEN